VTASAEAANASTMKSIPILVPKSNSALLIVGISKGGRCSHTEGVYRAIGNEFVNLCLGLGWSLDGQILILTQLCRQTEET